MQPSSRNPNLPDQYPWYPRTTAVRHLDDVASLSLDEQWRLDRLMEVASESSPRWVIAREADTLRSALAFRSETALARFLVKLLDKGLIFALSGDRWLLSPVLFPHVTEYPTPPSVEASTANLATHTLDSTDAQRELAAAMSPALRQAFSRGWKAYQEFRGATPWPVPSEANRGAYEKAKHQFKLDFCELYHAGVKPGEAIETLQERFVTQMSRDIAGECHTDSDVTCHVLPRDILDDVTFTRTDSESDILEEEIKEENHSNSLSQSGAPSRVTPETEMSRSETEAVVVTEAQEAEKAVVVGFMAEVGAPTPEGEVALIARDVANQIVDTYLGQGWEIEKIRALVEMEGECLRDRKKTQPGSSWAGVWRKSIECRYPPSDQYKMRQRKAREQAARAEQARNQEERHAAQTLVAAQERSQLESTWRAMNPDEQRAYEDALLHGRSDFMAIRIRKQRDAGTELDVASRVCLEAWVFDRLKADAGSQAGSGKEVQGV